MADRIITVDVQSNLREQTQEAKQFNKELDRVERQRSATRTGSRAADAALGVSDVGLRRGTTGAGGRGGERDFARQAQGLGGLVHIYATFAANLYAVAAAFTALSKAQDTANMVAAAKDLSAVYGVSLSNVAKQLSVITDGAISAKDALSFANLGGAAGLSTKQMTQLATVAKGASLALGRDLSDAMQRIYKGAIKIEPELLDELGIMVKLDQATTDYARTLGKSVSGLSDYERRQAYVNAVVKEGTEKFGELAEKSTNPYSKLLASTQNTIDATAQFLNKYLAPVVNILAESPTGLVLALGGITSILLKQAIPAITTYTAKYAELSKASAALATKTAASTKIAAIAAERQFEQVLSAIEPARIAETFSGKAKKSKFLQTAIAAGQDLAQGVEDGFNKSKIGGLVFDQQLKQSVDNYIRAAQNAIADASKRLTTSNISAKNAAEQKQIIGYYTQQLGIVGKLGTESEKLNYLAKEQLRLENESTVAYTKSRQARTQSLALRKFEKEGLGAALGVMYGGTVGTIAQQSTILGKVQAGALGVGQSIVTLGKIAVSSLPSIMQWLGIWGTVASVVIGAGKAILTSMGLFSEAGQKAADSGNAATESLNTVKDSIDKLSKARSLDSIFQLEGATLAGLIEAQKNIDKMSEDFATFATGPTLNKIIDSIPFMGAGAAEAQATAYSKAFEQAIASGQMTKAQATEVITGVTGGTGLFNDSIEQTIQLMRRSAPNIDVVAEKFAKLNDGLKLSNKGLEKQLLDNKNIESGLKDLNKASTDFVTALVPVTNLTKAASSFATVASAAISTPTSTNIAKTAGGITKETGIMLGITIPAAITEAINTLKAKTEEANIERDKQLKAATSIEQRIAAEQLAKDKIASYTESLFGPNSPARIAFISYTFEASEKFKTLANRASEASVALAVVGQKLRTTAFVESLTGPSAGLLKERLGLEKQQRNIQAETLKDTENQLTLLTQGLRTDITTILGKINMPKEDVRGAVVALSTAEQPTEQQKQALSSLVALNTTLLNQEVALANVRAQLKVLSLSSNSAEIEARMIANQVNKDTLQGKKAIIAAENTTLDIRARELDQEAKLYPYKADTLAIIKEELTYQRKQNDLIVQELELRDKLTALAAQYNVATTTNQKNSIAASMQQIGLQLGSITNQQTDLQLTNEQNKQYLDRIRIQNDLNKRMTVQGLLTQTASLTNESLYTTNQQRVKLYDQLLEYSRETNRLELQSIQNELDLIKGYTEAEQLERSRLEAKRDYVKLQQKERELDIKRQQRSASMKVAEEAGTFDETYWSNLGIYATEYFAKLRKESKSIGETFAESMGSAIDTISTNLAGMLQKNEFSWKSLGTLVRNTFSDIFRDLAAQFLKLALQIALFGKQGSSGGLLGTVLGAALGGAIGGASQTSLISSAAYTPGVEAYAVPQAAVTMQALPFAKGGIMTEYGPLQLNKYASGGIASGPQLAIFGEGRQNEAYVPLPDNRSIPVTLNGSGGVSIGDTNIVVNVNATTGDTQVSTDQMGEMGKVISSAVNTAVKDEFIKQARPGGLLYSMR